MTSQLVCLRIAQWHQFNLKCLFLVVGGGGGGGAFTLGPTNTLCNNPLSRVIKALFQYSSFYTGFHQSS